ncbi:MAG: polyhydroxyalkanoic acid system family protein [Chromatiales bacterium]|jgi:putative polyhydroxyalkanoate system protein
MARIHIKRQHNLGRDVARQRVEKVANDLQDRLSATWSWQGDSLCFERSGASGAVQVGDDFVEFEIKLGILLSPLKGTIEQSIEQQVDKALG